MKKWMRIAIGVIAVLVCAQIGIFAVQNHWNQKNKESEITVQSASAEVQEKDIAEKIQQILNRQNRKNRTAILL